MKRRRARTPRQTRCTTIAGRKSFDPMFAGVEKHPVEHLGGSFITQFSCKANLQHIDTNRQRFRRDFGLHNDRGGGKAGQEDDDYDDDDDDDDDDEEGRARARAAGAGRGLLPAREDNYQAALEGGHGVLVLISEVWGGFSPEAMRFLGELAQARNERRHRHRPRGRARRGRRRPSPQLPRPAALAGGAGGGRDRDRAGDQEERELLECARRTRDSSTGTPRGGVNQRTHGC